MEQMVVMVSAADVVGATYGIYYIEEQLRYLFIYFYYSMGDLTTF